jgi:hypothetical protein
MANAVRGDGDAAGEYMNVGITRRHVDPAWLVCELTAIRFSGGFMKFLNSNTIRALAICLALGGLAGQILHYFVLTSYRASFALPLSGDAALFRQTEEVLRSEGAIAAYIKTVPDRDELLDRVQRDVQSKRAKVSFDHRFRLTRAGLRDLPDAVVKDILGSTGSDLWVLADADDPDRSARLARAAGDFARDVLARTSLTDQVAKWRINAVNRRSRASVQLLEGRMTSDALARRISELRRVRKTYEAAGPAPANAYGQVLGQNQIQLTSPQGSYYLSPDQQLIGLESERIAEAEKQQERKDEITRMSITATYAEKLQGIIRSNADSIQALKAFETLVETDHTQAKARNADDAEQLALAELTAAVAPLRARFIETQFSPQVPMVSKEGPKRSLVILAGLLLGLAVWWLALLQMAAGRFRWSRPKAAPE